MCRTRVFIAFSSKDRAIARQIETRLSAAGYWVFLDEKMIPAGDTFDQTIIKAIKRTHLFVFMASRESVTPGSYALAELSIFQRHGSPRRRLITVLLEDIDINNLPNFARSVSVLEPTGDVAAEVVDSVDTLNHPIKLIRWLAILSLVGMGAIICAIALFAPQVLDPSPPGTPESLSARRTIHAHNVALSWIATGDDGNEGVTQRYEMHLLDSKEAQCSEGKALTVPIAPASSGSLERLLISAPLKVTTVCLRAVDRAGNEGHWKRVEIEIDTRAQLSAGYKHACVLEPTTVLCWGEGEDWQLGNKGIQYQESARPILGLAQVTQLASGRTHSCAISATDGALYCWGKGSFAPRTNGNPTTPTQVGRLDSVAQVSAGDDNTCAITLSGSLYCWGRNNHGESGQATLSRGTVVPLPIRVYLDKPPQQVSVGTSHVCALLSDGSTSCWGEGARGALGTGQLESSAKPQMVQSTHSFVQIAAGDGFTCAIDTLARVYCWGRNDFGQLGAGHDRNSPVPVLVVGLESVWHLSVGKEHVCALLFDGQSQCWGRNQNGQFGHDQLTASPAPVNSGFPRDLENIASGDGYTCAQVKLKVWCWGWNYKSHQEPEELSKPDVIAGIPYVMDIGLGGLHSCVVDSQGAMWCWGQGDAGQLGHGYTVTLLATPTRLDMAGFVRVSAGSSHTCGIDIDGRALCWGRGYEGQLGTGQRDSYDVPHPVQTELRFLDIDVAGHHSCALSHESTVWCWGELLGKGPIHPIQLTPKQVPLPTATAGLAVGSDHACAWDPQGDVRCWGLGTVGQLGDGQSASSDSPVEVVSLPKMVLVAVGSTHTCGLSESHRIWCWGHGGWGQLARETYNSHTPVSIPGSDWTLLASGSNHNCAGKQDGTVYCWGKGLWGELGHAERANSFDLALLSKTLTPTKLEAKGDTTCALSHHGEIYCWGANNFYQLGMTGRNAQTIPQKISIGE